jgi:alpha-tubulin suppressor-like RCC1 family protein
VSRQLGVGDTLARSIPTRVGTSTAWKTISGSSVHTCGTQDGVTVWCWGENDNGRLGLGDTVDRNAPVQITSFRARPTSAGRAYTSATLGIGPP